jgi:hypothetical protein
MVKINWKKYSKNIERIDLCYSNITEMDWEGCPPGLTALKNRIIRRFHKLLINYLFFIYY